MYVGVCGVCVICRGLAWCGWINDIKWSEIVVGCCVRLAWDLRGICVGFAWDLRGICVGL